MNCDQAIEFLPWLLNGSLEATERDEVRRHLATCEPCRAALNDTREAWTIFGQHIPGDALVALAYGEVPAGVDPAVAERHLATCAECAAELELARTSRRLEEDDKIAVFPGARVRQERKDDHGTRTWRAAALAASLAMLVAGTGWIYEFQQAGSLAERLAQKPAAVQETRIDDGSSRRMAELSGKLQEFQKTQAELDRQLEQAKGQIAGLARERESLSRPQAGALVAFNPSEVVRSETAETTAIPGDRLASLLLPAAKDAPSSEREAEIVTAAGKIVRAESRLSPDKNGYYALILPPGSLEPGSYTLRLIAREGGKRVARETWPIRIVKQGAP